MSFGGDQDAVDAIREIKACLTADEPSQALTTCDRMLSLRPGNRLFEGLKLEIENKAHEVRLESMRRLSSDLENLPEPDARLEAIQRTLNRYPAEAELLQLMKNATARRDFFNALVAEARQDEISDKYAEALERWHLIREIWPTMPGLDKEIRRVQELVDERLKRRAAFVDAIFRLSDAGDYTRAVYQCINALAEYPNDGGLITLKKNAEEKALHATKLQTFISEGMTFLQSHEINAALEAFAKANTLDQNNLQVRYLIGIAMLEKARAMMSDDRRRLDLLLDQAKSFIPNHPELPSWSSIDSDVLPNEAWDKSRIRVEDPGSDLQRDPAQIPAATTPEPVVAAPPEPAPPDRPSEADPRPPTQFRLRPQFQLRGPDPKRKPKAFRRIGLLGLGSVIAVAGWLVYESRQGEEKQPAAPQAKVLTEQAPLAPTTQTVSASLARVDLPSLLELHIVSDQPGGAVWIDGQMKGDISDSGITMSGVEPGVRTLKMSRPDGDVEISFVFTPGKALTPKSLPSRQVANVLFASSANEKSRVECNCTPAGLRIGNLAEVIPATGLEIPLGEGPHPAELWLGKTYRKLSIQGSRAPVATIAVFFNTEPPPQNKP
jgi:tetratricopeptide (TPR) repeat protein